MKPIIRRWMMRLENALISLFDWISGGFKEFKQYSNHYSINDGTYVEIDKQSILKEMKIRTDRRDAI